MKPIISEEMLDKVDKGLDDCFNPDMDGLAMVCGKCPYSNPEECTNKLYEDLKEIVAWCRHARGILNV